MEIIQKNNGNRGTFETLDRGKVIAEMTYVWTGNDSFIIDHTGVDPSYRGQHIGNEMVKHAVDYARENSVKILPMCPFARSVFDKNPSYSDVRK